MYRCAPAPANGLPLVKFVTLSYVRCMHALNFTTSRPLIFDFAKYTASITLSKNGNHFNPFLEVGVTLCFCWSLLYAAAANGVYCRDLILTCVCAPFRGVFVGNRIGCATNGSGPAFYCYVVDPVSCPIANPSNRFSGAGYRECEPSIEANTTIFVSVLDILANVSSLFCHRNDPLVTLMRCLWPFCRDNRDFIGNYGWCKQTSVFTAGVNRWIAEHIFKCSHFKCSHLILYTLIMCRNTWQSFAIPSYCV